MLHFSLHIPAFLTTKLPMLSSDCGRCKTTLKLPSTATASFISNSWQSESPISLSPPLNQSVAAIVFGDGSESRLYPLTKRRSEGAIPWAANYRLIDIVVSNCINSNISKIYALTQFNSTSLNSHLSKAFSNLGFGKEGFVEVLAAYQSPEGQDWFQGNADAVRRCLWVLEEQPLLEYLVLPGHHLYRMDYQKLIHAHRNSSADITISVSCTTRNQDPGFGFLKVNSENKVLEFKENPDRELLKSMIVESSQKYADGDYHIRSMGVYAIKRNAMIKLLTEYFPKANDFESEIIAGAISKGMKKCKIKGSVIGMRTWIGDEAVIEDSVVMGTDIYHAYDLQKNMIKKPGVEIPIGIGEQSHIRKAIIDKNARIGKKVRIMNIDNVQEGDRESSGYIISGGIVIVLRSAVIPDGSII